MPKIRGLCSIKWFLAIDHVKQKSSAVHAFFWIWTEPPQFPPAFNNPPPGPRAYCYQELPFHTNGLARQCASEQRLMTRHNLDTHLSWLLSQRVHIPPVGVHAPASTQSRAAAQIVDEDIEDAQGESIRAQPDIVPPRRTAVERVTSAAPRPATLKTVPRPIPDIAKVLETGTMGRLSSASRSARPTLISQQLATPSSTTPSSGGLTQGYSKFLRG